MKEQDQFFVVVRGDSMWPFLTVGGMVLIQPAGLDEVRIGDIVCVAYPEKLPRLHRCLLKRKRNGKNQILTKGDFCLQTDGWIDSENVQGIAQTAFQNSQWLDLRTEKNKRIIFCNIILAFFVRCLLVVSLFSAANRFLSNGLGAMYQMFYGRPSTLSRFFRTKLCFLHVFNQCVFMETKNFFHRWGNVLASFFRKKITILELE